jgi:hypothetical protein
LANHISGFAKIQSISPAMDSFVFDIAVKVAETMEGIETYYDQNEPEVGNTECQ